MVQHNNSFRSGIGVVGRPNLQFSNSQPSVSERQKKLVKEVDLLVNMGQTVKKYFNGIRIISPMFGL